LDDRFWKEKDGELKETFDCESSKTEKESEIFTEEQTTEERKTSHGRKLGT